jgi:DNA-binding protein Fis
MRRAMSNATSLRDRVFNFEATEEEMLGWYLQGVLERTGGNQSETQRVLEIDRATVRRRMAKLGLLPPPTKKGEGGSSNDY